MPIWEMNGTLELLKRLYTPDSTIFKSQIQNGISLLQQKS
jgi:hypothetical protein